MSVDYNERRQAIYRCKHRGKGCDQPGRSANGLHRAALLGIRLLTTDGELQAAIRHELTRHTTLVDSASPTRSQALGVLRHKRRKLLHLHYADRITAHAFEEEEEEEARLMAQLTALDAEQDRINAEQAHNDELARRFDDVATLLASIDLDDVWTEATRAERRILIEDLVEAVTVHPDHLQELTSQARRRVGGDTEGPHSFSQRLGSGGQLVRRMHRAR